MEYYKAWFKDGSIRMILADSLDQAWDKAFALGPVDTVVMMID